MIAAFVGVDPVQTGPDCVVMLGRAPLGVVELGLDAASGPNPASRRLFSDLDAGMFQPSDGVLRRRVMRLSGCGVTQPTSLTQYGAAPAMRRTFPADISV